MDSNISLQSQNNIDQDAFFNRKPFKTNYWRLICLLMDDGMAHIKTHWKSYFFYFIGFYFFSSFIISALFIVFALIVGLMFVGIAQTDVPSIAVFFLCLVLGLAASIIHSFTEGARFGVSYMHTQAKEGNPIKAAQGIKSTLKKLFRIFAITFMVDLPLILLVSLLAAIFSSPMGVGLLNLLLELFEFLGENPFQLSMGLLVLMILFLVVFLLHEVYRTWTGYALYFYTLRHEDIMESIKSSFSLVGQQFRLYFTARLGITFSMSMLSILMTWLISGITIAINMFTMGAWPILSVMISQPLSLINTIISVVTLLFCSGCAFASYSELFITWETQQQPEVEI